MTAKHAWTRPNRFVSVGLVSIACATICWLASLLARDDGETTSVIHSVAELRERYPFESLSRRLAYESELLIDRPQPKLSEAAAKRLEDGDRMATLRNKSPAMLHSAKAEEFVQRPGFGVSRWAQDTPGYLHLPAPTAPPIPLAAAPSLTSDAQSAEIVLLPAADEASAANPFRLPSQIGLLGLHFGSRTNLTYGGRSAVVHSDRG